MPELAKGTSDTLTSSDTDLIDEQMVVRTTSDLTGVEGRMQARTDEDAIQVYDGAAWVDAVPYGSWSSYTPSLTVASGTNPTLGTGSVQVGYFRRIGSSVRYQGRISFGSSGASPGSGTYEIDLPVTPVATTTLVVGSVWITDASASSSPWAGVAAINGSATKMRLFAHGAGQLTNAVPITFAASDTIYWNVEYEV